MNKPCYCCDKSRADPGTKENLNDLDRALNELGMLSVSTECRKQYLQEIVKRDKDCAKALHHGGFCVFHMNKKFVTNLVSSSSSGSSSSSSSSYGNWKNADSPPPKVRHHHQHQHQQQPSPSHSHSHSHPHPHQHHQKYPRDNMLKVKSTRRRTSRLLKPYELPWHHKLYRERARTVSLENDDTTCSSTSSSSSAGNRSNPGSPSKTGRPASGNGLIRSRSLDDLNCPAWDGEETQSQPLVQCREEIENVSRQMRHLTVT